jgi:hypothetical protein
MHFNPIRRIMDLIILTNGFLKHVLLLASQLNARKYYSRIYCPVEPNVKALKMNTEDDPMGANALMLV